jgi:hypothetical protein
MKSQRANETLHERADFLSAHHCTATNPLDDPRMRVAAAAVAAAG